jgi:hypothetical protein
MRNDSIFSTASTANGSAANRANPHGNIHGVSGYKETVSTVDRYVDKTYTKASRLKMKLGMKSKDNKSTANGLKSLRREISPPASLDSRRRLLNDDSEHPFGDTGSLLTATSTRTEVPPHNTSMMGSSQVVSQTNGTTEHQPSSSTIPHGSGQADSNITYPTLPITTLSGLSAFSSPHSARVFYAPPTDHDGSLLLFANRIRDIFMQEGLMLNEGGRALKLHATVANLKYSLNSKARGKAKEGKRRNSGTIDGTAIVEKFNHFQDADNPEVKPFVWAEDILIDRVRICKMGAQRSDDPVLGMVYPAIEVDIDSDSDADEDVAANGEHQKAMESRKKWEMAEVVFGS